jgi:hypothetical protein
MSPEAQTDIKMHFYDFYQIHLYVFNKFQIYLINYSGFLNPYSGNWGATRNIRFRAIVKGMSITKRA